MVQEFINSFSVSGEIGVIAFLINLILSVGLSIILEFVYVRFGISLSNRRSFARNFKYLALTTVFIISVIKSSVALSLGLVGALSIVRFRTAIKEPEELMYLFACISLGLGLGANQRLFSVIALLFFVMTVYLSSRIMPFRARNIYNLSITANKIPEAPSLDDIRRVLTQYAAKTELKRLEENDAEIHVLFLVEYAAEEDFSRIRTALLESDSTMKISFLSHGI